MLEKTILELEQDKGRLQIFVKMKKNDFSFLQDLSPTDIRKITFGDNAEGIIDKDIFNIYIKTTAKSFNKVLKALEARI